MIITPDPPITYQKRETAYRALFDLVSACYPWVTASRKIKLFSDVSPNSRPAFFQLDRGPDVYEWGGGVTMPILKLGTSIILYFSGLKGSVSGTTMISEALDTIETAIMPTDDQRLYGENMFGSKPVKYQIIGVPIKDVGDLDGDGLVVMNVQILLPI